MQGKTHLQRFIICIRVDMGYSANGLQELGVPDDILVIAQKNLFALKELLDTNPYLFHSAPGDHTGARSATANEQEAWKVSL